MEINDDFVMGLLPEGDQNYVVSSPEGFRAGIEAAKNYPGSNIEPGSISAGHYADDGTTVLVEGAWQLDGTPARIAIEPEGQDAAHPATVVTLAGEPGWGAYYFDATRHPGLTAGFRVVAYDANGEAMAETRVAAPADSP